MSEPLLPGPLGELPADVQEKIWACIPKSEIVGEEGFTARGMVAMFEATKRHVPHLAEECDFAIRQTLNAYNKFRRDYESE